MSLDPSLKTPVRSVLRTFASCLLWVTLAVFSVLVPTVSAANSPEEHVSVGQATIQTVSPMTPSLSRASEATILNWNSFSFVTHEAVRLLQPSVYSIALNRLIGADQSLILGQLPSEDSKIILINPHRNLLGKPLQINTSEFLATTLRLHAETAQAGRVRSERHPLKTFRAVVNGSSVHVSEHGFVALVAPGVLTEGVIIAHMGPAKSDPEEKVTLDLMSDGLIRYAINKRTLSQVTGLNDNALDNATSNKGVSQAQILLGARSAGDILTAVVNTGGVSRASRLVKRGGVVRLEGDDQAPRRVVAPKDASDMATDNRSRQTPVLAESASLPDQTGTDVPGHSSLSTTLLSGNDHAQKLTPSATTTSQETDSRLKTTAASNDESGEVNLRKPSPKTREDRSQTTTSPPHVSGHSRTQAASTSAPLGGGSPLKATAPLRRNGGKVNPLKVSPKAGEDRLQSMTSTSAVWRQPKWNFVSDWGDATPPTSKNGQGMTSATSQPKR